jgi:release factor glutamine methyltransferase
MATVSQLLEAGVTRLRDAGSESPRLDAELLLGRAVGLDRTAIIAHPEAPVGADAQASYERDVERRAAGEPVAYIRGFKEFFGIAFAVDSRALIPRPETEVLVELALAAIVDRLISAPRPPGTPPLRVADVGTGAGTIAVSIALSLRRRGAGDDVAITAIDLSDDALQLAKENAVGHGVADLMRFAVSDLLPVGGSNRYDFVLANLPYVRAEVVPTLPIAASFEPQMALDGGADGLAIVERLLAQLPDALAADGQAMLEIGSDQAQDVATLVGRVLPGWDIRVEPDLADHPRVAIVRPAAAAAAAAGQR